MVKRFLNFCRSNLPLIVLGALIGLGASTTYQHFSFIYAAFYTFSGAILGVIAAYVFRKD